ncbi:MAG: MBL fold metallo-hydrolase [Gammaproteobacteria bacterium]
MSKALRFSYLGSGSKGNSALVEADGTCLMVDCGFSANETEARLGRLERGPADIDAILVTHEHGDHIGGVARFARRHRIPVWMTPGTLAAARDRDFPDLNLINCHQHFAINGIEVRPMPVPHDAREPCQFCFSDGSRSLGILTDTGHITAHIVQHLGEVDALVIECNHDLDMLMRGPYPAALKQRVRGDLGHLNNNQSAELVANLTASKMQYLIAVHISEVNNTPELARDTLAAAAGISGKEIETVCQQQGLGWRQLS